MLYYQHKHISNTLLVDGTKHSFRVCQTETKVWEVEMHDNVRHWLDVFGFSGVLECKKPMKIDNELIE